MTNGIIIRNGVKYACGSSSSSSDVKVVDVVEKGNKNAVSSNAVANVLRQTGEIVVNASGWVSNSASSIYFTLPFAIDSTSNITSFNAYARHVDGGFIDAADCATSIDFLDEHHTLTITFNGNSYTNFDVTKDTKYMQGISDIEVKNNTPVALDIRMTIV